MGTLFLPSLTEKKFHEISNVTLEEATIFMQQFTNTIKSDRKIKNAGNTALQEPIVFHGIIDTDSDYEFDNEDAQEVAESIQIANTPGTRGARAIFVDTDGSFAVGTTVVYNRNWATIDFEDNSILDLLRMDNWTLTIDALPSDVGDDQNTSWYDSGC